MVADHRAGDRCTVTAPLMSVCSLWSFRPQWEPIPRRHLSPATLAPGGESDSHPAGLYLSALTPSPHCFDKGAGRFSFTIVEVIRRIMLSQEIRMPHLEPFGGPGAGWGARRGPSGALGNAARNGSVTAGSNHPFIFSRKFPCAKNPLWLG